MGRWALRALALLLVPVVTIAASSSGAEAASNFTTPHNGYLIWDDMSGYAAPPTQGDEDDVTCGFGSFWETNDAGLVRMRVHGGLCDFGFAFEWINLESSGSTVEFEFRTAGSVCDFDLTSSLSNSPDADADMGDSSSAWTTYAFAMGCGPVTLVCAEIDLALDGANDSSDSTCADFDGGSPEAGPAAPIGQECGPATGPNSGGVLAGGYPQSPPTAGINTLSNPTRYYLAGGVTIYSAPGVTWQMIVFLTGTGNTNTGLQGYEAYTANVQTAPSGGGSFNYSFSTGSGYAATTGVVGAAVIATNRGHSSNPGGGTKPSGWLPTQIRQSAADTLKYGGITEPSSCIWYFGAKIAQDASSTKDEPAGSIGPAQPTGEEEPPNEVEPPESDNSACDFDPLSPSTWLGGGMCAAVGLLEGIGQGLIDLAAALAGLAAGIVEALRPLLMELFIPDNHAWGFSDLRDTWESRPPGSLVNSFVDSAESFGGSFSSTASDECRTLIDGPGADSNTMLTTCSVSSSSGMSAAYQLVKWGLIALTALSAFRIIQAHVKD